MKKLFVKGLVVCMTTIMLGITVVGCGNTDGAVSENAGTETVVANTVGTKYVAAFKATSADDVNAIADELMSGVETELGLVKMDVEPGYLNGFSAEINGFDQGVMFSPMIGSIPFVGYVFKTSDAAALETALKDNADMRWNVCTEADELVTAVKGDYVFFMMCTNDEQ